jgi:hypothetical protein
MCEALPNKKCSRCGEVKFLSDFYKQPRNKDGLWTYCKGCASIENASRRELFGDKVKAIAKASREKHKEHRVAVSKVHYERTKESKLAKDKLRRDANPEKAKEQYLAYYQKHRQKVCEATKQYRELNPKKKRAHALVRQGLQNGTIEKCGCEVCGSEEVQGHHCDYDKPTEVMWLCAEHHMIWHSEFGEGLNGV